MKGRPFALLGVNSDPDRALLARESERQGINWRSWWDGSIQGAVARAWDVPGWPCLFVLDAQGTIRHTNLLGEKLDEAVETLVHQAEAKGQAPP